MMYFLYKLVCFLIYIDRFSMYILTELKMLFCYRRLNYTFFSAVFPVRSEAFMATWKGVGKKEEKKKLKKIQKQNRNRAFIQIHSALISHRSTSSESTLSNFNVHYKSIFFIKWNLAQIANSLKKKHIFHLFNV